MNYNLLFWILNIISTTLRFSIIDKTYLIVFAKNEVLTSFFAVFIFFFISWILFICTKKLYNGKTAFIAVLLLNILPVFSFLVSIITFINFYLVILWISALSVFTTLIETNNKKYWYLFGIIAGLAIVSKNNAILIYFSAFMFLFFSSEHRFWLKKKEPYLAFIISAIIFLPTTIWNIGNDWISFLKFQLSQGVSSLALKSPFDFFTTLIYTQVSYLSPLLFLFFIVAVFFCAKEAHQKRNKTALIIECFLLPTFLFFNILAIFNEVLPQCFMISYLVLSIYISHLILKFWYIKWFRIYSYIAWGLSIFITIIILSTSYKLIPVEKILPQSQNYNYDAYQQQKDLNFFKDKSNLFILNDYFFLDSKEKYGNQVFNPCINIKNIAKSSDRNNIIKVKNFSSILWELSVDLRQKLIKLDHKIFKYINSDLKCKFLDFYISLISYCDSKKFNLSFVVILIISIGILWKNKKEQFWAMVIILASALAIGAIVTYTLKYYFKSPRPPTVFGDKNVNTMFEMLSRNSLPKNSFPSGHTQIAFTMCTFMFMTVRKYWYWYILLSLGVAFERVYSGNHFPFDVLIGAAIGTLSTLMVVRLFKKQ